jgi:putative transposase
MAIPVRNSDPRQLTSGARTFFVTSSTMERRSLLQSDRAAGLFIAVLYDCRLHGKFRLHDFIVMPDHFHLLLTIGLEMTIERAMQFVKGGFSFRAGRELGMKTPVWQKGFSEVRVHDGEAFQKIRQYIRNNPIERRIVKEADQYPFSSAAAGFGLDDPPLGLKTNFIDGSTRMECK